MSKQLIHVGSITSAIKSRDILRSKGIKSFIERTPKISERVGCGYSIYVVNYNTLTAESILREAGIKILGKSEGRDR